MPGVQREGRKNPGVYEWKLHGNPWMGQGAEAIPARRLLIHILHALASIGWHLHVSADLSKKEWDKDSLFFKRGPPVQRYFFSITFNEGDKIRMIDHPNQEVLEAFKGAVGTWALGIQSAHWKENNCWQFKLHGHPWWTSDGTEIDFSRLLLCQILTAMEQYGFEMVASVDMSTGGSGLEENSDLDTWFFANKI